MSEPTTERLSAEQIDALKHRCEYGLAGEFDCGEVKVLLAVIESLRQDIAERDAAVVGHEESVKAALGAIDDGASLERVRDILMGGSVLYNADWERIHERDAVRAELIAALRPFAAMLNEHIAVEDADWYRAAEVCARYAALAERPVGDEGEEGDDAPDNG